MTKKIYENKNGHLSISEFLKLIHNNQLEDYRRKFRVSTYKCPPYELINKNQVCFYCQSCFNECVSQIKELKDCYKVKNKKYPKEELL